MRQYSLCNDPVERHCYQLGILRDAGSRGGSRTVHDELKQGDVIRISTPRNHFQLVPAENYLLFAGGIGVTPILCMAERLAHIEADFTMHYCARSADRMAFTSRIAAPSLRAHVRCHLDDGPEELRLDLHGVLAAAGPVTHLYVCGPNGFMDWVIGTAKAQGWPSERIHFEYFAAAVPQPAEGDQPFEIQLSSSGAVVTVPPDKSVATVLLEHGVEVPLSCEAGICGTCVTRILSGSPDHRDSFLTDQEHAANDQFTPCCSRSLTPRLVLDL